MSMLLYKKDISQMVKYLSMLILCCTGLNTLAQQVIPSFNLTDNKIYVPAFLPGIQKDPAASEINDTLEYRINSQIFKDGYLLKPGITFKSPATPWQTIYEMTDAYAKMDRKRIIALYADGSKAEISAVLLGQQGNEFLNYVNKATHANLKILAGITYKNGFLVYTKDDMFGLHENYIIKEKGLYKLSALSDSSPTGWNLGLYFKFNPASMIAINNLVLPDSMQLADSATLQINVPEDGYWISVFRNIPGGPVTMLIQDNGEGDLDNVRGRVRMQFKAAAFISAGQYDIHVAAFNFPVQRVSPNFFKGTVSYKIKIN